MWIKYHRNIRLHLYVGSEILTDVVSKTSIFCDIMTCRQLKVNRLFGETCRPPTFSFEEKAEQEASVKAGGKQRHSTLKM
jgi:hypothetical protein